MAAFPKSKLFKQVALMKTSIKTIKILKIGNSCLEMSRYVHGFESNNAGRIEDRTSQDILLMMMILHSSKYFSMPPS